MTSETEVAQRVESERLAGVFKELAAATPSERAVRLGQLVQSQTDSPLFLAGDSSGNCAVLDEIELNPAQISLRKAELAYASLRRSRLTGVDMTEANLKEAILGAATLVNANLERAQLQGADLAGADLSQAALGGANFQEAMLEEASLRGASLRFANLENAVLENADLRDVDLWGANLAGAVLVNAHLQGAKLDEANLEGANLDGANLQGASLGNTNLNNAVLSNAKLQGVSLGNCKIKNIHLSEAWLDRTRMRQAQLGGAIGEELAGDFAGAARGYLVLQRNFGDLGDDVAESWAYRKRRGMQKLAARKKAWVARKERDWSTAFGAYARYASDELVEWLCDYGESVPRVLRALFIIYLFFTLTYLVTGSVMRIVETPQGTYTVPTRNLVDVATFSLLAMSTSGSPAVGLTPRNQLVHLLTASEALVGIAMTGLLGYVLAHRIMR